MIDNIKYEYKKTKRTYLYIVIGLLLVLSIMWITWGTNRSLAPDKEKMLITNISVVNNVIYPLLITVLSNNLYNVEKNHKMLNILPLFNTSIVELFMGKYEFLILNLFIFTMIEQISLNIIYHIPSIYNIELFISMILSSILISIVQLGLSFTVKKESFPLFIGLTGTMISLITSGHLPTIIQAIIPWESIAFLAPLTLTNNGFEMNHHYIIKILWIIMLILIGVYYFRRKVKNQYDKNT